MIIYYLSHTSPDDGSIEEGPYFLNHKDAVDAAKIMEAYPCNKKYGVRYTVGDVEAYASLTEFMG